MIYTPMTKKAMRVCFDAHRDQVDKCGLPYVFHPFHLAEQMDDEISAVCALLHDVVEDSDYCFDDLKEMGFPDEVIEVLMLLTHTEDTSYMDYVKEIKKNPIATKCKLADLRHNSDLTRLDTVDEAALLRNKKYSDAIKILKD